jgi:hypothetical protein
MRLQSATGVENLTYGYDPVGNTTSISSATFGYNALNMMTSATIGSLQTQYGYDGEGRRVVKAGPTQTRYYVYGDQSKPIAEYAFDGTTVSLVREYIYLSDSLIASVGLAGETPPALSVALSNPLTGDQAALGDPITFAALPQTPGVAVSRVDFYGNGVWLGSAANAPYTITRSDLPGGTWSILARVVTVAGDVATSTPVSLTVVNVGRVTGITVSPNPIHKNQTGTITVTGNAYACGAVLISYGDGDGHTQPLVAPLATSPYVETHPWTTAGTMTVTAAGQGNCHGTATVTLVVDAPTPTVAWTAPANQAVITTGTPIGLTATASEPGGAISRVEFYSGTGLIGTATAAPYSFTWNGAPSGVYSLTAKAIDVGGSSVTTSPVSLTVRDVESVEVNPVAPTAGGGALVTVHGSTTCGAVMVNYGDGDVITYAISSLPITTYHSWATAGPKTVTAAGQGGCTGAPSLTVAVLAPPIVTLTAPSADTYTTPATITLAATASSSNGSITNVQFFSNGTWLQTATSAPYT